jgi:acyl-coenzyme A synthetase/AMP-(fatty) acid ligase/D-alanine-D-alanine ligase-like ATP-grasp enzyme
MSLHPQNISWLLIHQAQRSPQSIAVVTPNKEWTYAELDQRVGRYAQQLTDQGINAGDRLACIMSDELLLLTALLAAARISAPVMLVPRSSTVSQRNQWMAAAGVRYVLSDMDQIETAAGSLPVIHAKVLSTDQTFTDWAHVKPNDDVPQESIFIIVVGSGTTGKPKLMPITHAQMHSRVQRICVILGVTSKDRLANMAHMEYVGGVHRLVTAFCVGAGFVVLDKEGNEWRHWHARFGVTHLNATVFHAQQMLKDLRVLSRQEARPLDPIQLSLTSSVVTQELRQAILSELCSKLRVSYGTNEAWSVTTAEPHDLLKHPGTVGCPVQGVAIRIVDKHLTDLPQGQKGLVAIQSDQIIHAYLGDEQATRKAFREGWFIPGDLGYLTDNGQLIYCGRSDNMMIFNGINIYPIEIEQCLLSHPDVSDVLAMPTRHAIHQDVPIALVALKERGTCTEQQLFKYAASVLGPKQPRHIVLTPAIPRNRLGKPIKEEIIQLVAQAFSNKAQKPEPPTGPQIKISFDSRPETASQTLALWTRILTNEVTPSQADLPMINLQSHEALLWLSTVLDLVRALLQAARVPQFDLIKVTHCQPHASRAHLWHGVCQQPAPQFLTVQNSINLIRETFKLAEWASGADIESPIHREDFFKRIETGAFKTLVPVAPTGKSTFEILRVAHSLTIPYRSLAGGVVQLGWGSHSRSIHRSTTDCDSAIGLHLTSDKFLTAQILRQAGLPAPVHHKARSLAEAQNVAQRIAYPVVVKPSDLERGEGVAVDVTELNLEAAFQTAYKLSPSKTVLIERQVPGICHRLFIVDGELLYAVKRLPIGIYGDGKSSISELVQAAHIEQMKRPPWTRSGVQLLQPLPLEALDQQGLTPADVAPAGQFVALRRIETSAWGGVDEDVTPNVHPDNVSAAVRAAQLMRLEVAGVDLISQDITQAWHTNGAVINEVNYAPLLGGGEISRAHIPAFLLRILKGNGKIPIEVIVNPEHGWTHGLAKWQSLIDTGVQAFLTDKLHTLDPQGQDFHMTPQNLNDRVQSLLMNKDVEALVIVAKDKDEGQWMSQWMGQWFTDAKPMQDL